MRGIINYVNENKSSFLTADFNPVDSLVLSQLAYLELHGFVPGILENAPWVTIESLARKRNKEALYIRTRSGLNKRLLAALEKSPRFYDTKVNFYVNKIDYDMEKQFSAVTFHLSHGDTYIACRGTDFSFIGLKEDFNMAFSNIIPSHEEALAYLNQVGTIIPGKLKIGGHSKGGNLAIYAVMTCQDHIRSRVTDIFTHDAPGFREEIFQSTQYQEIKGLIRQYIPQSSLIGMLLNNTEDYFVVKSNRLGPMQHDPFSWIVEDGSFVYQEHVNPTALAANKSLKIWLAGISDADRALFVDTLYDIIVATGAKTFSDLAVDIRKKTHIISNRIQDIDHETKDFIVETVKELVAITIENLRDRD